MTAICFNVDAHDTGDFAALPATRKRGIGSRKSDSMSNELHLMTV